MLPHFAICCHICYTLGGEYSASNFAHTALYEQSPNHRHWNLKAFESTFKTMFVVLSLQSNIYRVVRGLGLRWSGNCSLYAYGVIARAPGASQDASAPAQDARQTTTTTTTTTNNNNINNNDNNNDI